MLISSISGRIISEMGAFFAPPVVTQAILDIARDFCRFSMIFNTNISATITAESIVQADNYGAAIAIPAQTDTEPCGMFGIQIGGIKYSGVERTITIPSGAQPVSASGTIFYKFNGSAEAVIHPVITGGLVNATVALMPTKTAAQIADALWDRHGEGLILGVKGKLLLMPNYESFNLQLASVFTGEYEKAKRSARAEVNNTLIGAEL